MAKVIQTFGPPTARFALVYDDEGDGSVSRFDTKDIETYLARMFAGQLGWVPGRLAWIISPNRIRLLEAWFGHNDFDRDELRLILHALEIA